MAVLVDPRCPRCPGPRVPHHCGLLTRPLLPTQGAGRGHGATPASGPCWRVRVFQFTKTDIDPEFKLRACVLGEGGSNLRSVREKTGASVCLTTPKYNDGKSPNILMELRVSCGPKANSSQAELLVQELMGHVQAKHDAWHKKQTHERNHVAAKVIPIDDRLQPPVDLSHAKAMHDTWRRNTTDVAEGMIAIDGRLHPDFDLRLSVEGENKENFQWIIGKTGAKLKFERVRALARPCVRIVCERDNVARAQRLVESLLTQVCLDHDRFVSNKPNGANDYEELRLTPSFPQEVDEVGILGDTTPSTRPETGDDEDAFDASVAELVPEAWDEDDVKPATPSNPPGHRLQVRVLARNYLQRATKAELPMGDDAKPRPESELNVDAQAVSTPTYASKVRQNSIASQSVASSSKSTRMVADRRAQQPRPGSRSDLATDRITSARSCDWRRGAVKTESGRFPQQSSLGNRSDVPPFCAVSAERFASLSSRTFEDRRRERRATRQTEAPPLKDSERLGDFCSWYALGACTSKSDCCPRGKHGEPPAPTEDRVLMRITSAKKSLLQQKWTDAGGRGNLVDAWQVRNPRLEFRFRAAERDFASSLGQASDVIDGWHGTPDENVLSIAVGGFDPRRRSGQVYGVGEYFAKDPMISVGYARGGAFMFLCKLLMGTEGDDHTWVDDQKYYVLKQRNCRTQCLPIFLAQFRPSHGPLCDHLHGLKARDSEEAGHLAGRQRGGLKPCEARTDAGMSAQFTRHLWVGWLAPELCATDDDEVDKDVRLFLRGLDVESTVPERNGARVGAFVLLKSAISKKQYSELRSRPYRGKFQITVDDQQPGNPRCSGKVCPRLRGPSHYCRGWNLRGHHAWQWGCPFEHPAELWSTHGATYKLVDVQQGTAKFDEIETDLTRSGPFTSTDGTYGQPKIVAVKRVVNKSLEKVYNERRNFLQEKHGFIVEKELWHGTNCKALPELLTHGLQPPSDTSASNKCAKSGNKGLCTTLCGTDCTDCVDAHCWDRCHMYGLGVYAADLAQKSHRYVREPSSRTHVRKAVNAVWQAKWGHTWKDCLDEHNDGLEIAYATAGANSLRHVCYFVGEKCYSLDLTRMFEEDLSNGNEWPVRRRGTATEGTDVEQEQQNVYSMLRCRVVLGSPYLIEGNLLRGEAMHDLCWCKDPTDMLETTADEWNVAKGHDSFYVRGLLGAHKCGLGVHNNEYIIFQPYQVLPMYQVDYVIE